MDKRLKIGLVTVGCALVLAVILALVIGREPTDAEFITDGEAPWAEQAAAATYPFSWERQKDGTMELTLTGQWENGTVWDSYLDDEGVASLEEVHSGQSKIVYRVIPLSEGYTTLCMAETAASKPAGMTCEINVSFRVDPDLTIYVANTDIKEPGLNATGVDRIQYAVEIEPDRTIVTVYDLEAQGEEAVDSDWSISEYDSEVLEMQGPITSEGVSRFYLFPRNAGKDSIKLYHPDLGVVIPFDVEVDAGGFLLLEEGTDYTLPEAVDRKSNP